MDKPMPYSPPKDPSSPAIYAWPLSAAAGEAIEVCGRGPSGSAQLEVARIGAERLVVHRRSVQLAPREMPPDADARGCEWPVIASLTVDAGWTSGYYEVVVRADDRPEAIGFFVVRSIRSHPDRPLIALTTNTWNAYNDVAGTNLYNGGTHASFVRPLAPGFLRKPDGPGSRVAVLEPPDPRMRAHINHIRTHGLSGWSGSAGWPS